MIRTRVIPVVLLDNYSVVKTIKFDVRRNLGNPVVVAKIYNNRNVDELVLLDIDATREKRGIDLRTVEAVAAECFMPLTVGGGLKSCDDISRVLKVGADKVSLNSVLFTSLDLFKQAVAVFGSQCIIASVDVKKDDQGKYSIFTNSDKAVNISLEEAIEFFNQCKVGEILLNNVDLDGVMVGFDEKLIEYIASLTKISIITVGGAKTSQDCAKAVKAGAQAIGAASIFHFTSITPRDCKEAMGKKGIPVRLLENEIRR